MSVEPTVRHVVYWDIDGTLLSTARAGVPALEDGAESVVGRRPDLSGLRTSGMTDRMIARAILESMGHDNAPESEARLLSAYTTALPGRLHEKQGEVLPGVVAALDGLRDRADVASVLLTGNMRAGAYAKLRHYGLWTYFSTGGFGEDGVDRADIGRAALARARERYGDVAASGTLIGDTPYDVSAGAEIGLRVVAVASAAHPVAELAALNPWWVVDRIPTADDLMDRIETATPTGRQQATTPTSGA
jgi:phosphoglycolate phosphatase-like HAD superfamily hydrolase